MLIRGASLHHPLIRHIVQTQFKVGYICASAKRAVCVCVCVCVGGGGVHDYRVRENMSLLSCLPFFCSGLLSPHPRPTHTHSLPVVYHACSSSFLCSFPLPLFLLPTLYLLPSLLPSSLPSLPPPHTLTSCCPGQSRYTSTLAWSHVMSCERRQRVV